jgi:hypothetical protein
MIHKGTETVSKDGTSTNFLSFRRAALACFALIIIFYSIFPEWAANGLISLYSDKTLYEIMTNKKAP